MKKLLQFCGAALSALFLCPVLGHGAAGGQLIYDSYLPINAVSAYSSTVSVRADGIDWASAQIVVASVTSPAQTFKDGTASSATLFVSNFASLSSATASGSITISSNAGTANQCVSGGGPTTGSFNACSPGQWVTGVTSSMTACSLAAAINSFNVVVATCNASWTAGVVFTSAPIYGSIWNRFTLSSSSQAALTVATLVSSSVFQSGVSTATGYGYGTFTGGQDNQSFTINGKLFLANRDWTPIVSSAVTAFSISQAITNSSVTTGVVASTANSAGSFGLVFATSTSVGTSTNYATASSSQSALTLIPFTSSSVATSGSVGVMLGGTNAAYVLNTSTITLPAGGFGTGQAVVYSTGSNITITPLIWGSTYYVINVPILSSSGVSIELAITSSGAVANIPIVLTSSQTLTTADSFTLTASTFTGTVGLQWVASNDNLHWVNYTTTPFNITVPATSVSASSYFSSGTVTNADFGHYNYGYLGLSITGPPVGAVNIQARIVGNAP